MIKHLLLPLLTLFMLSACAKAKTYGWDYGFTAAADEVFNTDIRFILPDTGYEVQPLIIGISGAFLPEEVLENNFSFSGSGGAKQYTPPPIKAYVEWVSYVDKKRYGIWLNLPDNLGSLMANDAYVTQCGKGWQIPRSLVFGVAPGGYIETYVGTGCEPDRILLRRDFAKEVQKDYDKQFPLESQYNINEFHLKNKAFFDKHTIPYWRFQLDQPPIAIPANPK